ncbi:hypothetical protein F4810DRAFT_669032 [Camillea tinctor]|nr:hypothetical protein F4810DRAFT_669032 [Camillea tinctor]
MSEPLARVDSAVEGLSTSPTLKTAPEINEGLADLSIKDKAKKEVKKEEEKAHRRASSSVNALPSAKDLWETKTPIQVSIETQKTGWKINTSSMTVEDREILKKPLVTPHIRSIDLVVPDSGMVMTVRSKKRSEPVTIKDALDAIHSKNKKKDDDELIKAYLAGFEWSPAHAEYSEEEKSEKKDEEDWHRLYIHLSTTPGVSNIGGKKKNKKNKEEIPE